MPRDPLYQRALEAPPPSTPEADLLAVHAFLQKARAYAQQRELTKRIERFRESPTPENAAKLHQWSTWIAFVEHALREIEEGTLDSWFTSETARGADDS